MSLKTTPVQEYTEIMIGEDLDYHVSYAKTLALMDPIDTIASSSWTITGPGVAGTDGYDSADNAWLFVTCPAAKIGQVIRLYNTVVTVGGRTHKRMIMLKVVNRQAFLPDPEEVVFETPA